MKYDIYTNDIEAIRHLESELGTEPDYDGPLVYFAGMSADKITHFVYLCKSIEIRDERGDIKHPEVK